MNFKLLEKLIKLDKLHLNASQIKEELESVRKGLEVIGFSPYESRAYIALVIHGYGNAETIATTAMIPRTSSYKILESLVEKGFANVAEGRPRIYKPVRPRTIHKRISAEVKNVFDKLEMLEEIISEIGEPQLFFMIYGKDKVISKIGELLDTSSDFFIISTPAFSEIYSKLERNFQNALKRGIDITVISTPLQRV
ncbi:MAG TPA: TrmB family transcriptional regulator, partial [Thermoplasmata archaeon]|nr:TrmB family transcriptional regulator [Thermoplasmata archaeon]